MNIKKKCDFSEIYKMKTPDDIPYNLPGGLSLDWYIEFYVVACNILKNNDYERYNICINKLNECLKERGY